jgi:tripartite-type tricarboxylate transporter receptor subunit TctC
MKSRRLAAILGSVCLVAVLVVSGCALPGSGGAKFPTGPVTLQVGFGAGGGTDTAVRGIVPYLQKYLGVSVLVENRPGATGLIAANYVMDSKADGYTLYVETNGTSLMAQLYPESWKGGAKQMHDAFISIYSWVNQDGNGLFVSKNSPFNSLDDLAAEAKKRPIKFGIAGGLGSTDQIAYMCVKNAFGGTWTLIPNDSGADVVAGVLGGTYDLGSGSPNAAAFDPAQLKMLAVTMQKRSTRFPDAKTMAELGKPQCSSQFVIGAAAPLGTPQDVVNTLEAAFDKARNDPEYIAWAAKSNQPIGDKGWDSKTFYTYLKDYWTNMQIVIPDLKAEVAKAQGAATPTPAK